MKEGLYFMFLRKRCLSQRNGTEKNLITVQWRWRWGRGGKPDSNAETKFEHTNLQGKLVFVFVMSDG